MYAERTTTAMLLTDRKLDGGLGEKSQMRDVEESREDARVISDGRGSGEALHGDTWLAGWLTGLAG